MFRHIHNACCLLCTNPINGNFGLCHACTLELPLIQNPCLRCALDLDEARSERGYCLQCMQEPPFFDYCHALGRYEYPLQELISRFKFSAKLSAGRAITIALIQEIKHTLQRESPDAFLPVPLHAQRIRHRGFNQSSEIAKLLARHFSTPLLDTYCYRQRATASQRGLTACARASNLRGAFALHNQNRKWGHIAIVDDVVTTKSTVNAIAQLLKSAGVKRVGVICLARVSEAFRTDT